MKSLKLIESSSLHILKNEEKNGILGGGWSCTGYEIKPYCYAFHSCGEYILFPGTGHCKPDQWIVPVVSPCNDKYIPTKQ